MKPRLNIKIHLFSFMCILATVICQDNNFASLFSRCHPKDPKFDSCIEFAINAGRQYFRTGVPQYGITPFDPFTGKEVSQKIGVTNLNYKLVLTDIYETGWAIADYKQFKSNFKNHTIQYTQSFPDKRVKGDYEFTANIFGMKMNIQGSWSLALVDLVQTTTITRKPRQTDNGTLIYDTPLKLYVDLQTCKSLKLHITNLLNGNPVLEYVFDEIINIVWPLAFVIFRPFANDLTATLYIDKFRKSFEHFPFNEIIH